MRNSKFARWVSCWATHVHLWRWLEKLSCRRKWLTFKILLAVILPQIPFDWPMFCPDFKVVLLVGIGTVGYFLNKAPDGFFTLAGKKGYLQFFLAVVVIGWILVVTLFCFFISGLHDRIPAINWPLCVSRYTFHTHQFLEVACALKLRMKMEETQLIYWFSCVCYQGGDSICCLGCASPDLFSSCRRCCKALWYKKNLRGQHLWRAR